MTEPDRLTSDAAKLREAVAIFRTQSNLHGGSSDESLIRWAHQTGAKRGGADMVRNAWHDFEHGRRYASLPVSRYRITYQNQSDLAFEEPAPPPGEPAPAVETVRDARLVDDEPRAEEPTPACPHKVRLNDGKEIVCDDCGEVLGPAPPEHNLEGGAAETSKRQSARRSKRVARKVEPREDEEEVLF